MADEHASRRRQRLVVFAALYLSVATVLLWPYAGRLSDQATAQGQSSAYQPFGCPQSGGGNRKQTLQLLQESGSNGSGTMYPCVSGVPWVLTAGNVNSSDENNPVAQVTGVYNDGNRTVSFAANGSQALAHVSFRGLSFCSGAGQPFSQCQGPVTNIDLFASSAAAPNDPKPATPYTLRIDPDTAITIGGGSVLTDLWATPGSEMTVPGSQVPFGAFGCVVAGTWQSGTCKITLSSFGNFNWLIGGNTFRVIGVNLTFYYLATHRNAPTDPYTQPPVDGSGNPLDSIKLPNTRIFVQ